MNRRVVLILGCLWVLAGAMALAQSAASSPSTTNNIFGIDPEDAYLSPSRYANAYFGFAFELPDDAALKLVPMPASTDRRIQLLEMSGATAEHAGISLSAYEYKNKNYTDAKTLLRRELDQELFVGVEELHGIGKTTVGSYAFYYYETRRGVDQHVVLAGEMNGYVLNADLRARDPKLVHELLAAFSKMECFTPQETRQHAGAQATPYQGPAISAEHLREVRESVPGDHIEAGRVAGNVYRNDQIGLTYEFPAGWSVEPHGAVEPAVERYREKVSGEPLLGPRERAVVKACRRTLLSVWRHTPDSEGQVPYDEFGEVTLSTMPLSCFPNIRFPEDPKDAAAIRQFVVGLSFTLPLQRDMTTARTYEAGGKTFVLTQGTIAYKAQNEALSTRISVALAMTANRGYLLIWLFAAPHEGELRELLQAKVGFVPSSTSESTQVATPGGGTPSLEVPAKPQTALPSDRPEVAVPSVQSGPADARSELPQPVAAGTQPSAAPRPSLENPPQ